MVGRQTNFEYGAHEINNISQPGINQIVYFTSRTEIPCKLTMYLDYYGSSRIRLKCPKMPILRLVDCFWVAVETNKWSWWFQRIMVTEDAKNKLYNHIIIIVEKKYVFLIWYGWSGYITHVWIEKGNRLHREQQYSGEYCPFRSGCSHLRNVF